MYCMYVCVVVVGSVHLGTISLSFFSSLIILMIFNLRLLERVHLYNTYVLPFHLSGSIPSSRPLIKGSPGRSIRRRPSPSQRHRDLDGGDWRALEWDGAGKRRGEEKEVSEHLKLIITTINPDCFNRIMSRPSTTHSDVGMCSISIL